METPVICGSKVSTYVKYQGKYIATTEYCSEYVIASGNTKQEAYERAVRQGYPTPVIAYIAQELAENSF